MAAAAGVGGGGETRARLWAPGPPCLWARSSGQVLTLANAQRSCSSVQEEQREPDASLFAGVRRGRVGDRPLVRRGAGGGTKAPPEPGVDWTLI